MSESAKFWDGIAEKYSKQSIADEAAYQKKLKITQRYFKPEMQVLELGCGTGSTAIIHAPFVKHIRATDISSEMLRIAKEKADAESIDNITFDCESIDELQVSDQSMDMVLAHSILHLLEDKEAVIGQAFKMLKPGGLFISSTACLDDAMWFLKPVLPVMKLFGKAPEVVKFFSSKQLVKNLTNTGFEIEHEWKPGWDKALFIVAKKPE